MDPDTPPIEGRPLPPLPVRAFETFVSPGRLVESLTARPAWAGALLLGAVLVIVQNLLIPPEVWEEFMRAALLAQGREVTELGMSANVFRLSNVVGGLIGWFLRAFVVAGFVTVAFDFVLGDEGRYRQHLAVVAHASLIPAVVGLLLVPLRIAQENPQFNLSLGDFVFFLGDGYPIRVLDALDLTILWSYLVIAQGAHTIDPRRSFGSAVAVVLVLNLVFAMVLGPFRPQL